MSKKLFTLFDTTELNLDYTDYVGFCEHNEITPEPENSEGYQCWCNNEKNRLTDNFLNKLRNINNDNDPVIITGYLEFVNGRKEIYPMLVESDDYKTENDTGRYANPAIWKAVIKCINGMDNFRIELAEGDIIIHGYHHDGCNILTISKLSKKGKRFAKVAFDKGKRLEPKVCWHGKIRETDLWANW